MGNKELEKLGLISTRDKWLYLTLGILAGSGTVALFYFFITELNKVFN